MRERGQWRRNRCFGGGRDGIALCAIERASWSLDRCSEFSAAGEWFASDLDLVGENPGSSTAAKDLAQKVEAHAAARSNVVQTAEEGSGEAASL